MLMSKIVDLIGDSIDMNQIQGHFQRYFYISVLGSYKINHKKCHQHLIESEFALNSLESIITTDTILTLGHKR